MALLMGGGKVQSHGKTYDSYSSYLASKSGSGGSTSSNSTSSGGGSSSTPAPAIQPTSDPKLDQILASLSQVIEQNLAAGNTVNPALNITPELAQQFISEARQAVDPYTQQLLDENIQNINAGLESIASDYRNTADTAAANFEQGLGAARNQAANAGIALSGVRGKAEENMLQAQNRNFEALQNQYGGQISSLLRQGGSQVGKGIDGLRGSQANFVLPELRARQATLAGPSGAVNTAGKLSYNYNPDLYSTSALSREYNANVANQANQNLSNYLKSGANNGARTFQLGPNGQLNLQ